MITHSVITAAFHCVFSIRCAHCHLTALPAKHWPVDVRSGSLNKLWPCNDICPCFHENMCSQRYWLHVFTTQLLQETPQQETRPFVSGFPLGCCNHITYCVMWSQQPNGRRQLTFIALEGADWLTDANWMVQDVRTAFQSKEAMRRVEQ